MANFLLQIPAASTERPVLQTKTLRNDEIRATEDGDTLSLSWGDPSLSDSCRSSTRKDDRVPRSEPREGRSILHFDNQTGRLSVTLDQRGLFPCVFARDDAGLVIASDLGTLLAWRPDLGSRIDAMSMVQLLALGQLIGDRTPWSDIRQIPTGASLTWTRGTPPVLTEPDTTVLPHSSARPQEALDALVAAVDQRLKAMPDSLIPLSGGLDSRLLLACARASGHRPDTFCYGAPGSADRMIASDLAEAAECAHHAATLNLEGAIGQVARAGGGEVPFHHGHGVTGAVGLGELLGRPVLTGTGSETFRAFYYDRGLPGLSALGNSGLSGPLMKRAQRWATEHMSGGRLDGLPQSFAEPIRAELDSCFTQNLRAAPDLARGLDAIYLQHRVGRFVVAGQQLLNGLHPRAHPFLDDAVVEVMSGLPVGWKLGARFHRWAIEKLSPKLAGITWDKTDRPLSQGLRLDERWPGLADRIGRGGRHAKAGKPLADYADWAAGVDGDAKTLRTLDWIGQEVADRTDVVRWIAGLDGLRVAGTLAPLRLLALTSNQTGSATR